MHSCKKDRGGSWQSVGQSGWFEFSALEPFSAT